MAAPKSARALADFARGVAAYKAEDYEAAAAAFGASYDTEPDTETLFAWAQAERQLGRCNKAMELYDRLLARTMSSANRDAIEKARAECRDILANNQDGSGDDGSDDTGPDGGRVTARPSASPHLWYQDPIGDVITGAGVIGLAIGGGFYIASQSAYAAARTPPNEMAFNQDRQAGSADFDHSVQSFIVGGVLVAAGVTWYLLHRGEAPPAKHRTVSGWLDRGGGGLTFSTRW
jgi:tetratricopeptide (TPR) repeat protein